MPSSSEQTDLFLLFTERLGALGLRYAVTGSVASLAYGEPRLTHDVDLVLEMTSDAEAAALCAAFPGDAFYCAPLEVVKIELRRRLRGHFNIIHHETGFKADVYLCGHDELNRWAVDGARRLSLPGGELRLAPPEYVIVRKLEYYREGGSQKHLQDIRAMLRVSGAEIDRTLVERHVEAMHLNEQWAEVEAEPSGKRA